MLQKPKWDRHYPAINFFGQFFSIHVTHNHVISATMRSHEVITLSQIDREICLQQRIILIKISIFRASDAIILFQE